MSWSDFVHRLRYPRESAKYERAYMERYGVSREKARADIAGAREASREYAARCARLREEMGSDFVYPPLEEPCGAPALQTPEPARPEPTPGKPGGSSSVVSDLAGRGSLVPAAKPRVVTAFGVEEHADRKVVTVAEGYRAAPAPGRKADAAAIEWGESRTFEDPFPELPWVKSTVCPGEILRISYDRTTYDGQPIKYVDLLVRIGDERPVMPESFDRPERQADIERLFGHEMMRLGKGVGSSNSKGCDVSFASAPEGARAYYAFKLTLDDGRVVYESPRNKDGVRVPCEAVLRA